MKLSYQYKNFHYKDTTPPWQSYLYNWNPYSWKDGLHIETGLWYPMRSITVIYRQVLKPHQLVLNICCILAYGRRIDRETAEMSSKFQSDGKTININFGSRNFVWSHNKMSFHTMERIHVTANSYDYAHFVWSRETIKYHHGIAVTKNGPNYVQ